MYRLLAYQEATNKIMVILPLCKLYSYDMEVITLSKNDQVESSSTDNQIPV